MLIYYNFNVVIQQVEKQGNLAEKKHTLKTDIWILDIIQPLCDLEQVTQLSELHYLKNIFNFEVILDLQESYKNTEIPVHSSPNFFQC